MGVVALATLTLRALWINLVATGEAVSSTSAPGREAGTAIDGDTRTYAGGRRRSISKEGDLGNYQCVMRLLTRTQVDTLIGWRGRLVQVRDDRGRKYFGVYRAVNEVERKGTLLYDVPITLEVVTHTEGV